MRFCETNPNYLDVIFFITTQSASVWLEHQKNRWVRFGKTNPNLGVCGGFGCRGNYIAAARPTRFWQNEPTFGRRRNDRSKQATCLTNQVGKRAGGNEWAKI
jgi:hypothetical protein